MPIQTACTFLVAPEKSKKDKSEIGGTLISHEGRLFDLIKDTYDKSDDECRIEIAFNQSDEGQQENYFRDLLLAHLKHQTLKSGRDIAQHLASITTRRSGLGLLFLICGKEADDSKIVVSRFPADSGILADQVKDGLNLEFLERVFLKSAKAYKSAIYRDQSMLSGFWLGKAVDKQINSSMSELSNYWINDFLKSDYRTTAAAGTRRFAEAVRAATKGSADAETKAEISSFATLISNGNISDTSPNDLFDKFNLSEKARELISNNFRTEKVKTERFRFQTTEFSNHIAFRTVETDRGAILIADAKRFNDVILQETDEDDPEVSHFRTTGRVVGTSLRKTK